MPDIYSLLANSQIDFQNFSLRRFCLAARLSNNELEKFARIVHRSRRLRKRDYLFHAGDPMQHVYAVHSGAIKTYLLDTDGEEQITGFIFPEEMLGLDAIGSRRFCSYAVALEESIVCLIDIDQLEELAGHVPSLRHQLLYVLSQSIHDEREHVWCNRKPAQQRLASFLIWLSVRYFQRGLSPDIFILPMTRAEIGNYLNLTVETVSRLFARYANAGLIECHGREVCLLDRAELLRLSGLEEIGAYDQTTSAPQVRQIHQ